MHSPSLLAQKLDNFFNKIIPKKFFVLVVATVLVFMGKIEGFHWFVIASAYLGLNVAQKFSKYTDPLRYRDDINPVIIDDPEVLPSVTEGENPE
jgi:hypothetical protein